MELAKRLRSVAVVCVLLTAPLAACDSGGGSASAPGPAFQTKIVEQVQEHFASTQPAKRRFMVGRLEYAAGEHALPGAARPAIAELGGILAAHPDSVVRVESFATETGTDADEHLAARRAYEVQKVLVEAGVTAHHVFSATADPKMSADASALGPIENGRTDVIIYTKKGFETAS